MSNRGRAPEEFLRELVAWAATADEEIFSPGYGSTDEPDIYRSVAYELGWKPQTEVNRRAMMCEVLRVLAGFESSWRWEEGEDLSAPGGRAPREIEAGIFQVSANSGSFDRSLKELYYQASGGEPWSSRAFQALTKRDHRFAIEYCARLLRFTVRHHGPLVRGEVYRWMSPGALLEFSDLIDNYLPHSADGEITREGEVAASEGGAADSPSGTSAPSRGERVRILIDPGHGGQDSGAVGRRDGGDSVKESDIVLSVGQALRRQLIDRGGYEVQMTRESDRFVTLSDRAAMANRLDAVLISIHANAGGGTGFEAFTSRGQTRSDEIATEILAAYEAAMPELRPRYDSGSDGDPDKEAGFAVLTRTRGPAVLVELGFVDSPHDLSVMLGSIERMARALADGLDRAFHPGASPADTPETAPPTASADDDWTPTADERRRILSWLTRILDV